MRTTWTFHSAGQLVFGSGAVAQLGELTAQLGIKRLLLVTDALLCGAGVLDQTRQPLEAAGVVVEVFDGGKPEPSMDVAEQCIAAGRSFKPDGVLGLGGGSNMDLAKITATVLTHGGAPRDYVGDCRIKGPVLPIVCVPTTSGTGSEVTAASVLTDTANQVKVGILSNYLRPRLAVVDPRLTLSCPAKVTADSGIDALTHAIEGYTAVDNATFPLPDGEKTVYQGRHPLADCLAEKAIALIGRHLVERGSRRDEPGRARRNGPGRHARRPGVLQHGRGPGACDGVSRRRRDAMFARRGQRAALALRHAVQSPRARREFASIARLLGQDVSGLSEEQAAERAITAVEQLKRDIGIPQRLRDLGVHESQLPAFAEKAFSIKRILRVNPRTPSMQDIESIYRAAL